VVHQPRSLKLPPLSVARDHTTQDLRRGKRSNDASLKHSPDIIWNRCQKTANGVKQPREQSTGPQCL